MAERITTRRQLLFAAVCLPCNRELTRSFWVFKLLAPRAVVVRPTGTARLHCSDGQGSWIIEANRSLTVKPESAQLHIAGPGNSPVPFQLDLPGVLCRSYTGTLILLGNGEVVRPIVTMTCEIAVNSIVSAELPISEAPFAAMAAQAVVSRSILLALNKRRHPIADFCDTTHCQFLRAPAPPGSRPWRSANETAGFALKQNGHWMSPRFSAACGGYTEAGFNGEDHYVSVECEGCKNEGRLRQGHG